MEEAAEEAGVLTIDGAYCPRRVWPDFCTRAVSVLPVMRAVNARGFAWLALKKGQKGL